MPEVGSVERGEVADEIGSMDSPTFFANFEIDDIDSRTIENNELTDTARMNSEPEASDDARSVETINIPEVPETPEEKEERDRKYLKEYYGNQQFTYKTHTGTIDDMLDSCPYAGMMLRRGADAVISWLDKYKNEEVKEDKKSDDETFEEEDFGSQNTSKDQEETNDKPATDIKIIPKTETKTEALKKEPAQATKSTTVAVETKANVASTISAVSGKTKEVAVNVEVELEKPAVSKRLVPESKTEKADAPITAAPENLGASNAPPQGNIDTSPDYAETVALVFDNSTILDKVLETEVIEKNTESIKEIAVPNSNIEKKPETQAELVTETIDLNMKAELVEQKSEGVLEYEEGDLSKNFAVWQELAKDETPLEELFITISEHFNPHDDLGEELEVINEATANLDDSEYEETHVSNIEVTVDSSEDVNYEKYLGDEAFDVVFEEEAQPEVYAMFVAVKSARIAVDRLYTAKTKQECLTYINELVIELSIILRALGYDNPEKIVRDFLAHYSPESLKKLMVELESSLRKAMYNEQLQQNTQQAHHRQTRLSKFVNYIMQVATSHHPSFSLASK